MWIILFSSLLENANVHSSSINQSIKINHHHHYYNSNFLYNHQCDQKFVIQYYNVKKISVIFQSYNYCQIKYNSDNESMNVWNGLYGPEEMILIHYDNDEDFHNFFLAIII